MFDVMARAFGFLFVVFTLGLGAAALLMNALEASSGRHALTASLWLLSPASGGRRIGRGASGLRPPFDVHQVQRRTCRSWMHLSGESLADCKRCGRAVHKDHCHVMVVPVGHKRMYFHAGCEPSIRDKPDLAEDKIGSADKAY